MSTFTTACAGFITESVIIPIVNHLNGRGVAVSVEELVAVLQMPSTPARAPMPHNPVAPPMAFGGGMMPPMTSSIVPTAAAASSRKAPVVDQAVPGQHCIYKYSRGANKNKFCGKPPASGSPYCATCLKTKKNLSGAVPPMGMPMGMPMGAPMGMPPGVPAMSYSAPPAPVAAPAAPSQLRVKEYDPSRNLFLDPVRNFIVRPTGVGGPIVAVGKLMGDTIVPLSESEKVEARSLRLEVRDDISLTGDAPASPPLPSTPAPSTPITQAPPSMPLAAPPSSWSPSSTQAPLIPSLTGLGVSSFTHGGASFPSMAPLPVMPPLAPTTTTATAELPTIPDLTGSLGSDLAEIPELEA